MKVKGVLIDVYSSNVMVVEMQATLENYYNALQCDIIDIVNREINGKRFDIVCDDEGLFKENPKISAIDKNNDPMLVGNLFICNVDVTGKECSLSDSDIELIMASVKTMATRKYPNPYPMLVGVDW